MLIIADENIPLVQEAFGHFGEVRTLPGRNITPEDLKGADALLVRSITQVNAQFLQDAAQLRYVGTATIGMDHVDTAYLAQRGIPFFSSPGCNANSVAEYVFAALLELEHTLEKPLAGSTLGIVGMGHIGSIVYKYAEALGMRCVAHDPPRALVDSAFPYQERESVYACDFVTLHVPLDKGGINPTYHMVDDAFLSAMKQDAVLLNTSRGAVVDNASLKKTLQQKQIAAAVLDVWENEPTPDAELLSLCSIGTPHIAGYSYDGKVNATLQLREAFCRTFGLYAPWEAFDAIPPPDSPELRLQNGGRNPIHGAMQAIYDIMADDMALLQSVGLEQNERGAYFDQLRKYYRVRRECRAYNVHLTQQQEKYAATLGILGFQIKVEGC